MKAFFNNIQTLLIVVLVAIILFTRSCSGGKTAIEPKIVTKVETKWDTVNVVKEVSGPDWKISSIERQKFYEAANEAFAVITTNETRPFGCFIFTKGVIKPDGSVWKLETK